MSSIPEGASIHRYGDNKLLGTTDTYLTFEVKDDIKPSLVFKKDGYHDETREVNPYHMLIPLRAVEPGTKRPRPEGEHLPTPSQLNSPPPGAPAIPAAPPPASETSTGSPTITPLPTVTALPSPSGGGGATNPQPGQQVDGEQPAPAAPARAPARDTRPKRQQDPNQLADPF